MVPDTGLKEIGDVTFVRLRFIMEPAGIASASYLLFKFVSSSVILEAKYKIEKNKEGKGF